MTKMCTSSTSMQLLLCLAVLCAEPSSGFASIPNLLQHRSAGLALISPLGQKRSILKEDLASSATPAKEPRRCSAPRAQSQQKFSLWPGKRNSAKPLQCMSGGETSETSQRKRDQLMSSLLAFGAVAGTSALSWLIEQGGTLLILAGLKSLTGASTLLQVFETLAGWAADLGVVGFFFYAGALTLVQVVPICNGILSAMAIGLMFGTVKGLAIMSIAATASAVICLLLSRRYSGLVLGSNFSMPETFRAVASGISGSWRKTLLLVSLVRLSPVVPFCLSNYLFGLTNVELLPYSVGTWIGTLPGLFVWVSAGVVGKSFATGGAAPPPGLIAIGVLSTVAVLGILGKVSQAELNKMSAGGPSD